ncbi:DUF3298 domain-containing protein [Mycobacteroides salmoniphilum]|uniref:DUF3298 domain-containing protein n=1 Tax=Mycobacteroides salmoniphilum TaxID=404941 RepID=UPI0010D14756|nr:DUF3298 domain-containing protein [Mycobacteroides salmoniphilum]TDZ99341.1 hypothetical protein CCUG62472_00579 [Mycobacteroides salmoniphilum]
MKIRIARPATAVASAVAVLMLAVGAVAWADPVSNGVSYGVVSDDIVGTSWNGLGNWSVRYQRIDGGNPDVTAAINDAIDNVTREQVQTYEWRPSTTHHWTFDSVGTLSFRPITISALFTGEYNTDLPNMPFHTVSTQVFDSRSGIPITWDNLFRDKSAGLTRLSEQTAVILPTTYPPPRPGAWRYGGGMAPIDINFKYWIPTTQGIELHFPDFQFGRGLKVITVPWAKVADLLTPTFLPIMG